MTSWWPHSEDDKGISKDSIRFHSCLLNTLNNIFTFGYWSLLGCNPSTVTDLEQGACLHYACASEYNGILTINSGTILSVVVVVYCSVTLDDKDLSVVSLSLYWIKDQLRHSMPVPGSRDRSNTAIMIRKMPLGSREWIIHIYFTELIGRGRN